MLDPVNLLSATEAVDIVAHAIISTGAAQRCTGNLRHLVTGLAAEVVMTPEEEELRSDEVNRQALNSMRSNLCPINHNVFD